MTSTTWCKGVKEAPKKTSGICSTPGKCSYELMKIKLICMGRMTLHMAQKGQSWPTSSIILCGDICWVEEASWFRLESGRQCCSHPDIPLMCPNWNTSAKTKIIPKCDKGLIPSSQTFALSHRVQRSFNQLSTPSSLPFPFQGCEYLMDEFNRDIWNYNCLCVISLITLLPLLWLHWRLNHILRQMNAENQ